MNQIKMLVSFFLNWPPPLKNHRKATIDCSLYFVTLFLCTLSQIDVMHILTHIQMPINQFILKTPEPVPDSFKTVQ